MAHIPPALVHDLAERAKTARWAVSAVRFQTALEHSLSKAFPEQSPNVSHVEKYVKSLHLEDLALACACQDGHDGAWEHFIREFRPPLYRAASAIDPTGGARDLADALYADLFGLTERDGVRQSLLRYYHGRSSLATWLRSVLSQRHIDRLRAGKRLEPLPEPDESGAEASVVSTLTTAPNPDRARHVTALLAALAIAVSALAPRDRLRLACYHAQNLTLAQIGRMTGEHEATVSRHLTRTRRDVRQSIEAQLTGQGMGAAEIAECFAAALEDSGSLDVTAVLGDAERRKLPVSDRST